MDFEQFDGLRSRFSELERLIGDPEIIGRDPRYPSYTREHGRLAKTLAALNHQNIGGIYGTEEHEGLKYLILEYIDGETLAERIAHGPVRVREALEIGAQIANALAAAHDAGFIHRDLKPANVKITAEGTAKVLDFGLARAGSVMEHRAATDETRTGASSNTMTAPGAILGTVQYMSPEQARGGEVDRRTDLWALGVVLYECLTGTSPFARSSPAEPSAPPAPSRVT